MNQKRKWLKVLVLIGLVTGASAYLGGCGSGVEFGATKFVLTGAGS